MEGECPRPFVKMIGFGIRLQFKMTVVFGKSQRERIRPTLVDRSFIHLLAVSESTQPV